VQAGKAGNGKIYHDREQSRDQNRQDWERQRPGVNATDFWIYNYIASIVACGLQGFVRQKYILSFLKRTRLFVES
jgi:hypothetical protein